VVPANFVLLLGRFGHLVVLTARAELPRGPERILVQRIVWRQAGIARRLL
jgi:hypothetical protein